MTRAMAKVVQVLKPIPVWVWGSIILLLGLITRLLGLGAESAWIDEGYSIALAKYSFADILAGTAADQHPPLYYLLLHLWMYLGSSVSHARMLSVFFGLINVWQVMLLGRKIGGEWLGLVASLLVAVNPMHIWYSQEARQYMLLAVLTTAATYEIWVSLQGKRHWLFYGLFALLSMYTHYFALFILISHGLLVLFWTRWQRDKKLLLRWLVAIFGTFCLFLLWLPTAINQFLYHRMPWIAEPELGDILDVPLRLLLGSGVLLLPEWARWLGTLSLLCIFLWATRQTWHRKQPAPAFVFLAAWSFIPYIVISVVSIYYPLFQFKQFLILLAPILLLALVIANLLPGNLKYLVLVGLFLVSLVSSAYQQTTLNKDDWRGMSEFIQSNFQAGDLIFTNPAGASLVMDIYLSPSLVIEGYPPGYDILIGGWQGDPVTSKTAAQELSGIDASYDRIWLVEFFPDFWDPSGYLPAWLDSHARALEQRWFGKINLRLYDFTQVGP